jgi:vacuolar-type H+-ATPase subunit I/STV1|tara:strand:- start:250 stop:945 length:696 start_codon:yes stop_codon:yes gene_type:complete
MALPKLEVPKYTLTLPSSGEVIEYRPFLVKEEKNLMIAQETGDGNTVFDAIKDIVKACSYNKLNPNKMATYDLEYVFLQIRAKAVGEQIDIKIKDEKTEEMVPVTVNITDVYVDKKDQESDEKVININDSVGMTLSPITVDQVGTIETSSDLTTTIKALIKNIFDAENVYPVEESNDVELNEFVETLPHSVLREVNDYLTGLPQLTLDVEFKGPTGHKNKQKIRGFQSFFG